jgi:hypothetical protein
MRRALLLMTLAAGCSFPDPSISVVEDTSVDTSVAADSKTDAPAGETIDSSVGETLVDAATDAVDATDSVADAVDSGPTDTKMEVNLCETADPCDCDGDGDKAKRTGCGGGNDCDDGDPRRNSLVTTFQDYKLDGVTHGGDWDCSGTPTKEYAENINCGSYLATTGCSQQGYKGSPACGTTATFVRCKNAGLSCGDDTTSPITVRCK